MSDHTEVLERSFLISKADHWTPDHIESRKKECNVRIEKTAVPDKEVFYTVLSVVEKNYLLDSKVKVWQVKSPLVAYNRYYSEIGRLHKAGYKITETVYGTAYR